MFTDFGPSTKDHTLGIFYSLKISNCSISTLFITITRNTNPLVFLGYITSERFSRDYRRLTSEEKMNFSIGYARIIHGSLTDREIQMATFKIRTSEKFDDHSIIYFLARQHQTN
ncbi:unnamed protein product [Rotaria sordida]|uniref:Uncharacterized protein n=1 Tax=Rotaria sordida TaxID=392033 RepID=A0A819R3E8_9BILA|nr:unnamed protein product [Rotaria sordida]CAF4041154.1 unnamed protein product [Rotaria sordida]